MLVARSAAVAALVAAALLVSGCASTVRNRFIRRTGSGPIPITQAASAVPSLKRLASQMPPSRTLAAPMPTVESTYPELRSSLAALLAAPSAAAHLRVGLAYQRVLVLDLAIEHFDDALKMDARMAGAYDARARVWRDWGLLGPAVGDANRAVFFAPRSAGARNTLGTILSAIGDRVSAGAAYRCAMSLEPAATWARINLHRLHDQTAASQTDCLTGKAPRF